MFHFKPSSTVERIYDSLMHNQEIAVYDPKFKYRAARALHSSIENSPLRSYGHSG
jgi:hypothetical protein